MTFTNAWDTLYFKGNHSNRKIFQKTIVFQDAILLWNISRLECTVDTVQTDY